MFFYYEGNISYITLIMILFSILKEKKLLAESEAGDDSNSERLKQVYEEMEARGVHSAEARARRILAVSYYTCS